MDRLNKKPPVAAAAAAGGGGGPRKRKKAVSDAGAGGPSAAAAGGSGPSPSPPPAAKKQRVGGGGGGGGGPKGKGWGSKADRAQGEDAAGGELPRDEAKADAGDEERSSKLHTGMFSKDLPWLMYGFGDTKQPHKETVDLVEEIAMQYITDTVHAAMRAAAVRTAGANTAAARKDELRLEDILYAVRRDPRKVSRIQELIRRQQDIDNAKRLYKADGEDMPAEI